MKLLKIGDLDMNGQPVIYHFLQATDCRHQQEQIIFHIPIEQQGHYPNIRAHHYLHFGACRSFAFHCHIQRESHEGYHVRG